MDTGWVAWPLWRRANVSLFGGWPHSQTVYTDDVTLLQGPVTSRDTLQSYTHVHDVMATLFVELRSDCLIMTSASGAGCCFDNSTGRHFWSVFPFTFSKLHDKWDFEIVTQNCNRSTCSKSADFYCLWYTDNSIAWRHWHTCRQVDCLTSHFVLSGMGPAHNCKGLRPCLCHVMKLSHVTWEFGVTSKFAEMRTLRDVRVWIWRQFSCVETVSSN